MYDDYDHVFSASEVIEPAGEEAGICEPLASAYLVGSSQCINQVPSMLGEKIRMALGNVPLPLFGQFHRAVQVRAVVQGHEPPSARHGGSVLSRKAAMPAWQSSVERAKAFICAA